MNMDTVHYQYIAIYDNYKIYSYTIYDIKLSTHESNSVFHSITLISDQICFGTDP